MKLYDYLVLTNEEVIVEDKDFGERDFCIYGIKGKKTPLDKWDEAEMNLAKLIDIVAISKNNVTVNLKEVIESKMPEIRRVDHFFSECDSYDVMSILVDILIKSVSDKWLTRFVEVLKT